MKRYRRGFSLLEVLTVITIAAFLALGVAKAGQWVAFNSKVLQLQNDMNTLRAAVQQWKFSGGESMSLHVSTLADHAMLPEEWGTSEHENPWGGGYQVAGVPLKPNAYVIMMDGFNGERIVSRLVQYYGNAVDTYHATDSNLYITFK
ncbi:MAG: type II secretion system GspH family protein [Aliidiomarina sp.]|uniref:type II secretion system protein n=1 Tax=Aliidiomarina sp. TaxID=1872439 RepID=UPI0025C26547|nr:type II secretion system protein [Aliidiomarina sp.]MCH8501431.1 type II secretion system GspH family protein [Aliidiomarina sp.]